MYLKTCYYLKQFTLCSNDITMTMLLNRQVKHGRSSCMADMRNYVVIVFTICFGSHFLVIYLLYEITRVILSMFHAVIKCFFRLFGQA